MPEDVRLIDRWFPIEAVDEAVSSPIGSGKIEKSLMTWFASRPVAQARAAVLTSLLPDGEKDVRRLIEVAICGYDKDAKEGKVPASDMISFEGAIEGLSARIAHQYPHGCIALDPFSGRGIIPLEASRFGVRTIGIDVSPLATFAGRLLGDFPHRVWDSETRLPEDWYPECEQLNAGEDDRPKLLRDVEAFLQETGRRFSERARAYYPKSPQGTDPWGYLWAVTITCDNCKLRFPLIGRLQLRMPYRRIGDDGQWLRIVVSGNQVKAEIKDGIAKEEPTFVAVKGSRSRSGRCPRCHHSHSLDALKRKGFSGDYQDRLLAVAEHNEGSGPPKLFRLPHRVESEAIEKASHLQTSMIDHLSSIPSEAIPPGNNHAVRGSAYGYKTYGSLMCTRQQAQLATLAQVIRETAKDAQVAGISSDYTSVLAAYGAAVLARRVRYSTRGASLKLRGNTNGDQVNSVVLDDIYASESKVSDGFDFFELGLGYGTGSWETLCQTTLLSLSRLLEGPRVAVNGRFRTASATALPLRDDSVDVVITDPPYYDMIPYADASDILYVWVRRALFELIPDLFGPDAEDLQPKHDEIIVKRSPGVVDEHRTVEWYHQRLSAAFQEMRRVLKSDGHLTVVFGHHDPDAWVRLLGALRKAGFVVTSSWPSRTESANTGVASIKVTVTIGCRPAPENRPDGMMNHVDLEVRREVKSRVEKWTQDGLALPDQLMAAYGPAMEVFGRYQEVYQPNGEKASLERYLLLSRSVVKDATSLRLDELPLETFDAATRLGVFWLRFYGLGAVPKGESRFMAQTESIRIDDVRSLFQESRAGFSLDMDPLDVVADGSTSVLALARGMAARWSREGSEGVAQLLAGAEATGCISGPSDAHLWAVISDVVRVLPQSHKTTKALAALQRSRNQIVNLTGRVETVRSVDLDQHSLDLGDK